MTTTPAFVFKFVIGVVFIVQAVLGALVSAIALVIFRAIQGTLMRRYFGGGNGTANAGNQTWPAFKAWWPWRLIHWYYSLRTCHHHPLPNFPQNYILAMHPHGLFAVAGVLVFGFSNQFETVHLAGHSLLFAIPFLHELCSWIGVVDASPANLRHCLSPAKKYSLALYPGGVREMQMSTHHTLDLLVEHEKAEGFLVMAYEMGVPVVPTFCANECQVWKYWPAPERWRQWFMKKVRYPTGLFFLGPFPAHLTVHTGRPVWPNDFDGLEAFRRAYYIALSELLELVTRPSERSEALHQFIQRHRSTVFTITTQHVGREQK